MFQSSNSGEAGPNGGQSTRDMLDAMALFVLFFVQGWASMIYAFTRRQFGLSYFSFGRLIGVLILSVWAVATVPPHEMGPHNVTLFSFIGLAMWHRLRASPMRFQSQVPSQYNGWPRLCDWLPIQETTAKNLVEPVAVMVAAGAIAIISPSLGAFVFIGGLLGGFDNDFIRHRHIARARQIRDAECEQEAVMDAYDRYFNK